MHWPWSVWARTADHVWSSFRLALANAHLVVGLLLGIAILHRREPQPFLVSIIAVTHLISWACCRWGKQHHSATALFRSASVVGWFVRTLVCGQQAGVPSISPCVMKLQLDEFLSAVLIPHACRCTTGDHRSEGMQLDFAQHTTELLWIPGLSNGCKEFDLMRAGTALGSRLPPPLH
jgi:hypothetical protein